MRVWDITPHKLCRQHLLGEHVEIHAIWTVLTEDRDGYRNHPEVERWEEKLNLLLNRHEVVVQEMKQRGHNHNSPLDSKKIPLSHNLTTQDEFINTPEEQVQILKEKCEECMV